MELLKILPEIIILASACLLVAVEALRFKYAVTYSYLIALSSLSLSVWLLAVQISLDKSIILNGEFVIDYFSSILKIAILSIGFYVFLYSRRYLQERDIHKTEYYALGLFAILGMMVLTSSASLLTLYIGLELMSLSMYAMVAFLRHSGQALEAAIKYFVLGAIASGMLLYGMSFIYGNTGTLELSVIAEVLPSDSVLSSLAMMFIVAALLFKLGVVPFHMWLPDVYQGAPTATTLFISTIPKIAGFAIVMRLLVEGMGNLFADWQQILIVTSVLSIALGNVAAIAQSNLKRLLAYSGIAHIGFFLFGVLAKTDGSFAAAMFYIIVYAFTTLGGFGVIILLSKRGFEAENLSDYKGLGKKHPWYAVMLTILLFSMAGVPPMAGFYAKLSILKALISVNMTWLAAVAVVFSIIGAYYYLRVIVLMYFEDSENNDETDNKFHAKPAPEVGVFASLNALGVLLLGLFPAGLMALCIQAITTL